MQQDDDDYEDVGIPWEYIIAAIIVDGLIQIPLTALMSLLLSHYNIPSPNVVLWWLGIVIFYSSLNYWHPVIAGRLFLAQCVCILVPLIAFGIEFLL